VIADPCCPNYPHPKLAPGQAPYTCAELAGLYGLVRDAALGDPGELGEAYLEPPDPEPELVECYDDGVIAPADQMTYLHVQATGRNEPFCPACIARQGMVL
jgi:hypothetical protein